MLNKAPIFVNGFQRGGTTLLMNLLASHPGVCRPDGETHEVLYGRPSEPIKKWVKRFFSLPVVITTRQLILWPKHLNERNAIPRFAMHYIDWQLYWSKLTAPVNRSRNGCAARSLRDIARARLLCKNVNGVVLGTDLFRAMYPDATFVALVRNGLALCEAFVRRGWTAVDFAIMYERVCQKIIRDAERVDNYHVVRFEDMMRAPTAFIQEVYALASLDVGAVKRFRLRAKPSMDSGGVRKTTFGGADGEVRGFGLDEIEGVLRKDVNENQIARLAEQDRQTFLKHAGRSMATFGYG